MNVVVPDTQDFFTQGPISSPCKLMNLRLHEAVIDFFILGYQRTSQSLSSLPSGPLSLYTDPPLVDPNAIIDLEMHARRIATSMDTLTENLTEILHGVCTL